VKKMRCLHREVMREERRVLLSASIIRIRTSVVDFLIMFVDQRLPSVSQQPMSHDENT
jgi:hypothetical protein